ncbi:MAG TPA: GNAT family acetyltransferase [Planctomycetaceae bacterium]|nr:GNAT family acetyltransferase [Planctomycetaceae bacterium]
MQWKSAFFKSATSEEVIALWAKIFAYPEPRNDPATVIRQKLALQRELFFVALIDTQVVGTVMGGYDGHRGWIYSLAVDPAHRRQKIGAALVTHVERALEQLGCSKINLQVLPSNAATVEFYAKLGYRVEERISMGKVLSDPSYQSDASLLTDA